MSSRDNKTECFVYITLPGETEFITAAKIEIKNDRHGIATGRFVYGKNYLQREDKVPIDPIELKLSDQTYSTTKFRGMFGALRDASPDYWGRRVIEKHISKTELNEMDYLLHSPDDRAGALGFGLNREPPAPLRKFNRTMDLGKLQQLADAIIADEDPPETNEAVQVQELMLGGTSMGGARPKNVVEDEDGLWIAKFNRPDDKWNHARVEKAMLELGEACGIKPAESKISTIGGRDVLLVKRFDRQKIQEGYLRARMLSALTLLRAEDTQDDRDKWSYVSLVEELRRISAQPKIDAQELFRRMCFNALISNTDDHPRNHAVIALNNDWKLSPAYDLTPSPVISNDQRDLALICGDYGRYANADNLLSQSARFDVEMEEAKTIINNMEKIVKKRWHEIARREGVTEADCDKIARAFVYEGFRLSLSSKR